MSSLLSHIRANGPLLETSLIVMSLPGSRPAGQLSGQGEDVQVHTLQLQLREQVHAEQPHEVPHQRVPVPLR